MTRRRRFVRYTGPIELGAVRILTRIIILQFLYYISAVIMILCAVLFFGYPINMDLFLNWKTVRGDVTSGWILGSAWILNSIPSVIYILLIIRRSNLVADFAITIHLIHIVATWIYSGSFPTNILFWLIMLVSMTIVTLGCSFGSRNQEMNFLLTYPLEESQNYTEQRRLTLLFINRVQCILETLKKYPERIYKEWRKDTSPNQVLSDIHSRQGSST